MAIKKIVLGKLLLEKNVITQEQLDAAIAHQQSTGEKLGKALVSLNYLQEKKLLQLLSEQLDIPYVDLKNYNFNPEDVYLLSEFHARRLRAIVLKTADNRILVGMVDPLDIPAYDELSHLLQKPIDIAIVREADLLEAIDIVYRRSSEIISLAEELSAELTDTNFDIAQLATGVSLSDAPVMRLLQTIFEDAAQVNASDIHIEPDEHILRIRQRIDGILHEQILKEIHVAAALTLKLKLMGGLNIAEKRLPQDGRFSIKIKDKNFDVRLSTLPTQFGESVVMRLLNQSAELLKLTQLGIQEAILNKLLKIISMPNGLLLVTGPTGSGKTTTLYGLLSRLNTEENKIITVEDPVEYRMARINQVQIQPKIDLTFSRVLRSILRQDPDIIMIGELRDQETVEIALRASITGHFVFSTLHTNDAVSSIIRLIDMGAEQYLIATVLRAILAQRLVRRICHNCIEEHTLTPIEESWLANIRGFVYAKDTFKQGVGCTYCHNTGYKGQIGVYEFLEVTPALAEAIRKNNSFAFNEIAQKDPQFEHLVINALKLAMQGVTTLNEIIRILGEEAINIPLPPQPITVA